jgi:hypothetical protein
MPDGRPPDLPPDAPLDLREFIECKRDSVTIKQGELTWLPLPPEIKEYAPNPTLGLEPGASPGTGTMTIGISFATLTIPVSISDGELHMDTSGVSSIPGAQEAIDTWLKDFNDWLKKNGKRLEPTSIKDGSVTLTKEPIVAVPATPPPPAPPGPPVKPVTPVPPASSGGIGGSCALFGLLGVLLIGAVGVAWVAGIIPGSGGGSGPSTGPSSSTADVAKPSTTASTAPVAKPSTSTGPIAKPSTSTGPAKAPLPAGANPALDLLEEAGFPDGLRNDLLQWYVDPANDMYFPAPGQTPKQYFAESDLAAAGGALVPISSLEAQGLSKWPCGKESVRPDGTSFRVACNQDRPLTADQYAIFITTHAGGYPATFPAAGNHSWSIYTNPDNDLKTGFQSNLRDNYLIGADSYFEMLAFTDASGNLSNYVLATRMSDPVRVDTKQKQGNLPTTARAFWFDDIGTQLWVIPEDDFGGTNWYAGNFATLNRGANSPDNLAADALLSPAHDSWLDYYLLELRKAP